MDRMEQMAKMDKMVLVEWGAPPASPAVLLPSRAGKLHLIQPFQSLMVLTDGKDGSSIVGCTASKSNSVATIKCGDAPGISIFDGIDGKDGAVGVGCEVSKSDTVATITCGEDETTVDIRDGAQGPAGANGVGCTVTKDGSIATFACGSPPTEAQIKDGTGNSLRWV
jgi:hypothetical protein